MPVGRVDAAGRVVGGWAFKVITTSSGRFRRDQLHQHRRGRGVMRPAEGGISGESGREGRAL